MWTPDNLEAIAKTLGALAAIAGVLWGTMRFIAPIFTKVRKSWDQVSELVHELRPNGGASLRDAVDRMEKSITVLVEHTNLIAVKQWALVSAQPSPVFETNETGECVRANPAYLQLTERDFDTVRGYGWENILHPDDRDDVISEWAEAVKKKRAFDRRYRIVGAITKTIYRVQCYAVPYLAQDQHVMGYLGRYVVVEKMGAYNADTSTS